ncbi:hypothetical protein D9758_007564 [Tetrapyrgos nigripes]|uniref:Uncharacterized protein n=1 Tax=Tetrapyrgos nigripes TaxID=182062 RepID=A0A8H5LJN8_9AGAR|nr:hypothetical protein D9758_007564 [Tetrapyrgos nigripes]
MSCFVKFLRGLTSETSATNTPSCVVDAPLVWEALIPLQQFLTVLSTSYSALVVKSAAVDQLNNTPTYPPQTCTWTTLQDSSSPTSWTSGYPNSSLSIHPSDSARPRPSKTVLDDWTAGGLYPIYSRRLLNRIFAVIPVPDACAGQRFQPVDGLPCP